MSGPISARSIDQGVASYGKRFVWEHWSVVLAKDKITNSIPAVYFAWIIASTKILQMVGFPARIRISFPAIAVFEVEASVSRKLRDGQRILRDFYLLDENTVIYPVDEALIRRSADITRAANFSSLRGADLIFACIARLENAYLVTLDNAFQAVSSDLTVINLRASLESPDYRRQFGI